MPTASHAGRAQERLPQVKKTYVFREPGRITLIHSLTGFALPICSSASFSWPVFITATARWSESSAGKSVPLLFPGSCRRSPGHSAGPIRR